MSIKVLILTGYGINAEKELAWAFEKAGGSPDIIHLTKIIENKNILNDYQIIGFPGGFSFGDHIASGKVLANLIKFNLIEEISEFIEKDKLIIGICNGFQIITKLGIVPDLNDNLDQNVSLVGNDSGHFENRWVWLKIVENDSVWLKNINEMYLPIRHGEGKLVTKDYEVLNKLKENNQIGLKYFNPDKSKVEYPFNPNGSIENIAGIVNKKGNVFGLMPHPEAYIFMENHPNWDKNKGKKPDGIKIFENGINYFK